MPRDDLPILPFADRTAWASWLSDHHESSPGLWIKIARKASGIPTVTHPEALEEALCYGWIDGQRLPHDESFFLQRFTPRTKRSKWSQINRDKVTSLIEQGRMKPAGLAQIEAAKQDGRWEAAYAPQSDKTIPEDFERALEQNPEAHEFFKTLRGTRRYSFIYRIQDAKRPETRARRIEQFVEMLAKHQTHH
ncbi:MAG TPA: YdeI/OmpD-associated family protein [Solirubrobacteraceae bacterium]|nr:YdeI/OmpD-associated family protein [Solirubrobacteraceae bacterium]